MFHTNVTCQACGDVFSYESKRKTPKIVCSSRCRESLRVLTPEQKAAKVERIRRWREANPELNKKQRDAHSEANRERFQQEAREYYNANRDLILAKSRARRANDPEAWAQKSREHYALNAETINAAQKAMRESDPDKIRARDRARYWAARDERLASRRAYEDRLRDADPAAYYRARSDSATAWRQANPEKARLKSLHDHAMRRARLAQVECENFNYVDIYERDRWVCHICELRVMKHRRFPDRWAASLDHVIPISKGGAHTPENVKLAHFRCNAMKRDRDWIE